uniref:Zinc finger protein 706 n=1 Tax=Sus scrofa TaxID=9823 RepID=A0A8D1L4G0_PIG
GRAAIGPRGRKRGRRAREWGRGGGLSRKASGREQGEAGGAGATGRAARRARARGVVASPKAEAAAGARGGGGGGGCEARAVVLSALPFPLLGGWRRSKRCWTRSPSSPATSPALSRCAVSQTQDCPGPDMARGQQKIQSQQKNAKKQAGQKKKQGHDQKAAAKAALIYTCTVCRTQMPDPKTFKQHFESKHPKTPLPPELADVQA